LLLLVWCQRTSLIVLNKKADSTLSRSLIGSDEHCYFLKFHVKKYLNVALYLIPPLPFNNKKYPNVALYLIPPLPLNNTSPNISLHFLFPFLSARWWGHQSEICSHFTRPPASWPTSKSKKTSDLAIHSICFLLFFNFVHIPLKKFTCSSLQ